VQIDDLLPIAFYFDVRGPARPGADLLWRGQSAIPWEEVAATYADATGEGLVSQNDLLPMGLHFGKEHETTAGIAALGVHLATTRRLDVLRLPAMEAGTSVTVSLSVGEEAAPVESLLGVASEVVVPSVLRLIRTRPGEFLDDQDLLSFRNLDEDTGTLSVAYARKGRENPVSGAGEVLEIEFETIQTTEAPLEVVLQKTVLSFESGTQEVEPDGQPLVRLVSPQATDIERGETEIVTDYALEQNYPNPFNPSTLITFALPDAGHVSLVVFDLLGRSVATLVDAPLNAGRHTVRFDASGLPGGIYVYRLRANDYTSSKQLVLVK
ncbi:MAG: T9SS type A sorting domain-containing protein, partial [Bacteroidota bacterium]